MGGEQMSIQRSCTLQYCVKPFKLIQGGFAVRELELAHYFQCKNCLCYLLSQSIRSFLAPSYECYRQYRMRLRVMGTLTENLIL
ncbi:hypothetical protein OIU74_009681 [Salix koriyanagi]|uniref:Uncharacterized protein n=1 Tax=Salix koriyanagi TaxID=2511006 RepID=A0A9Q0Z0X2_9ROSI|nr:hypothetical protein OIU74_009681 [Salix koriyanagi]